MSIVDLNVVDGAGISKDNKSCLALFLSDHLGWEDEYAHLSLLQDKINTYLAFIETQQYKSIYPEHKFTDFVIEIHFKEEVTDNCKKFLKAAEQKLTPLRISFCVKM